MKRIIIPFFIVSATILIIFLLFGSFEKIAENLLENYSEQPWVYAAWSFIILVSDIVMPVPSTIVMYLNGFVLGTFVGSILSLVSLMLSSCIGYLLGKFTPFKRSDSMSIKLLDRYGPYVIIMTRGIPVLAEAVSIMCGYIGFSFRKFLWLHLIGYVPICILYAYLGTIANQNSAFGIILGISIVITILFWFFGARLSANKNLETTE